MHSLAGIFALAAVPAAPLPVPVEQAPFHRLVLATEDYALIENHMPPGADSGFHAHHRDLFYVTISAARAATQRPGQPLRPVPPSFAAGTVGMNPPSDEPFVHRVVNPDSRPFHVLGVEPRRPAPSGQPITERAASSGFVQVHDHPRLRAWRLVLEPGQSAPNLRQAGPGLRIVVRGGDLTVARPGRPAQTIRIEAGDFEQLASGESRALHNRGPTAIEIVDIEMK